MTTSNETPEVHDLEIVEPKSVASDLVNPMQAAIESVKASWSNAKPDSEEYMLMQMAGIGEADFKADKLIGQEINLIGAMVKPIQLHDKDTGEVIDRPLSVLLMEDGSTVAFVSIGVLQSLAALSIRRPAGLWSPPIKVKLLQLGLSNGHRKYYLKPILSALPAPKTKGGKNGA